MILSFLKIAIRTLRRDVLLSAINIMGLAVGMCASLLILLYVRHEISFDQFHPLSEHTYRLTSKATMPGSATFMTPTALGVVAPALESHFPQVEHAVRIYQYGTTEIEYNKKRFTEIKFFWADSNFFKLFHFPLLTGDAATALARRNALVVSKSVADRIFGDENPVNKTVTMYGETYTITALVSDPPECSSIKFGMIGSFSSLSEPGSPDVTRRDGVSFFTYLAIAPQADNQSTHNAITKFTDSLSRIFFKDSGIALKTGLQPLANVHLNPMTSLEPERGGSMNSVIMFTSLAVIILLVAVVNYVNLFTVRGDRRAREIGLRKVVGANRLSVASQFIAESVLTALLSWLIAMPLTELLTVPFANLMSIELNERISTHGLLLTASLAGSVLTGVLAGAYPAFYLSRFQPGRVLKRGLSGKTRHGFLFQKILVTLQFSIAIFMIVSLGVMYFQVNYLKKKQYGFEKENVLVMKDLTKKIRKSYEALKGELLHNPDILMVTASQSYPGRFRSIQTSYPVDKTVDQAIKIHENRVQPGFCETLGIPVVEGNSFDAGSAADSNSALLNQAAVKALGLTNPVGSEIMVWKSRVRVAGVIADYHFLSLHNTIEPLVLTRYSPNISAIIIRIKKGADIENTMKFIADKSLSFDGIYEANINLLDKSLEQLYDSESRSNKLIEIGTLLALVLSLTGLFALSAFILQQRVKEVGVRKTFGATDNQVLGLLNTSFATWVLIAAIPAWPAAWLVMDNWLSRFSYTISHPYLLYPVAVLVTLLVALIATLSMSYRLSRMNPAEALRYE
ncbi:MAG: ABC transporter permease [Bacteroidales bacterium]|nr:ABC transporter permease [Bacteroidales bacterium]MDD3664437.1 ABC transporter permease [Bacteroidales bacterium]